MDGQLAFPDCSVLFWNIVAKGELALCSLVPVLASASFSPFYRHLATDAHMPIPQAALPHPCNLSLDSPVVVYLYLPLPWGG